MPSTFLPSRAVVLLAMVAPLAAGWWLAAPTPCQGESVPKKPKHIIGATATIKEASTGLPFAARIDTGAKSCSIHVEEFEITDAEKSPTRNIGKPIRFLLKNQNGDSQWVESTVAGRVRVRNSAMDDDDYHGRYKVRLTLEWEGVKKDVLVTLNDRTQMDYPLLIGRNFLRGDFLVDVSKDSDD